MRKQWWLITAVIAGCGGSMQSVNDARPVSEEQDPVRFGRQMVIQHDCGACHGGGQNPAAPGWLKGASSAADTFLVGPYKTYARNLTPDVNTGIGRYTERQLFNALRYGLQPANAPDAVITSTVPGQGNFPAQPKFMAPSMPWAAWRHMSDDELSAVVAYLKRGVKPVSNQVPASEAPPDFWASESTAEKVGPYPAPPYPTERETPLANLPANMKDKVLRGRHLVLSHACGGCHGSIIDPAAPDWVGGITKPQQEWQIGPFKTRPRNLTPDNTTGMGRFSERQIFNALRFGLRPGETPDVEITSMTPGQGNFPVSPKYLAPPMPWPAWRHMADEDLWAIAAYLKHGVKPFRNRVADSEGPLDFWASGYTAERMGPRPAVPFPTANEVGGN